MTTTHDHIPRQSRVHEVLDPFDSDDRTGLFLGAVVHRVCLSKDVHIQVVEAGKEEEGSVEDDPALVRERRERFPSGPWRENDQL